MTQKFKMKLAFHLEPYDGRSASSVRNDIEYIITQYGDHPAFYRYSSKFKSNQNLPLFYIYDSYLITEDDWFLITNINGSLTIRDTKYDSLLIGKIFFLIFIIDLLIIIALYINNNDEITIKNVGFDGIYTYFVSENFTHGSTMKNWPSLSSLCNKYNLLFIPSVGPGYNDTSVRPWNLKNAQSRANGEYYKKHFRMAYDSKVICNF